MEDYLDQCLLIARERNTLFLPELAMQLAIVRDKIGHPPEGVRQLVELAISQAREHGNRHQELTALAFWLTRIAPEDAESRAVFRRLLGEVNHTDAPVLVRWVSLLDHRFALENLES